MSKCRNSIIREQENVWWAMEMGNKSNGQMQWTGDGVAVEPDWKQMWGSLSLILPEAVDQRREGQLAMDGKCRSSIKKELENVWWANAVDVWWTGDGVAVEPDWKQMWGSAPSGERQSEKGSAERWDKQMDIAMMVMMMSMTTMMMTTVVAEVIVVWQWWYSPGVSFRFV